MPMLICVSALVRAHVYARLCMCVRERMCAYILVCKVFADLFLHFVCNACKCLIFLILHFLWVCVCLFWMTGKELLDKNIQRALEYVPLCLRYLEFIDDFTWHNTLCPLLELLFVRSVLLISFQPHIKNIKQRFHIVMTFFKVANPSVIMSANVWIKFYAQPKQQNTR